MKDEATIVNEDDYREKFWKHNYLVSLGVFGNAYRVNADCEQDALDEVMDYCEQHAPGFVIPRENEPVEFEEDYVRAGNHGLLFSCPSHEIHLEVI